MYGWTEESKNKLAIFDSPITLRGGAMRLRSTVHINNKKYFKNLGGKPL